MKEWVKKHPATLIIAVVAIIIGVVVIVTVRNVSAKKAEAKRAEMLQQELARQEEEMRLAEELAKQQQTNTDKEQSQYQQNLGINNNSQSGRTQIVIDDTEVVDEPVVEEPKEPSYALTVEVFDHTEVPNRTQDGGTSFKQYYNKVSLADFGTFWGTYLNDNDFNSTNKIFIGTEQNPNDTEVGDLQSTGWLIENFDNISDDTAIKFTNLHNIGSMSDAHFAYLCAYDWYSAWGIKDTLVLVEDISGTLDKNMLSDGDIFQITVFKHNIRLATVNNVKVICIEYQTYEK